MTLMLSEEQYAIFDRGFWDARRIEDDILDLADREGWNGPVVVVSPTHVTLFALVGRER